MTDTGCSPSPRVLFDVGYLGGTWDAALPGLDLRLVTEAGAWHEVRPVNQMESGEGPAVYDVVGPVCESGDFLAKDRKLAPREGDLAVRLR